MIIHTYSFPRAGLIGNPSDGYFGKTIAFTFTNFSAEVSLYQTPELEILPSSKDHSRFESIHKLAEDVRHFGYYGGIRLLKAAIKKFYDYCEQNKIKLDDRNFSIRYRTDIPQHVGLAGSSAIITACLRALMLFYHVNIPKPIQANLILSAEKDELDIQAGLQDRVAQVYEGLIYMDFNQAHIEKYGYGKYIEMDPRLLPPLYIAYSADRSEGSEIFHNNIRDRFNRGEKEVINAMTLWAELSEQVRVCLEDQNLKKAEKGRRIHGLMNKNFDIRKSIYRISPENIKMIETARSTGASAKFTGSGGAIVGTYKDEAMYKKLQAVFKKNNIQILKPVICSPVKEVR